MKLTTWIWASAGFSLALAVPIAAIAQSAAPAGSTGECKDGTYSTAPSKRGACSKHGGVKDWYPAAASPAAATPAPTPAAAAPATPAPASAAAPAAATPAPAAASSMSKSSAASRPVASGGGPGLVWLNTKSNVYHCQGSTYYGKTKEGSYMSEADAKAKGAHADHGKACS